MRASRAEIATIGREEIAKFAQIVKAANVKAE